MTSDRLEELTGYEDLPYELPPCPECKGKMKQIGGISLKSYPPYDPGECMKCGKKWRLMCVFKDRTNPYET